MYGVFFQLLIFYYTVRKKKMEVYKEIFLNNLKNTKHVDSIQWMEFINSSTSFSSFRCWFRRNGIGWNNFDINRILSCYVSQQLARLHNTLAEVCCHFVILLILYLLCVSMKISSEIILMICLDFYDFHPETTFIPFFFSSLKFPEL